jgi:hypothetical protein
MANQPNAFPVPIECLYRGCTTQGQIVIHPLAGGHGYGITPSGGWIFYALGYPSLPNLGVCPTHQNVTVPGKKTLAIAVADRTHAVYYDLVQAGIPIGSITFPSNTLTMQCAPGQVSPQLVYAGRRVAALYGFSPDNGIVDDLEKSLKEPRILRGGPYGHGRSWIVDVEYISPEGPIETVALSRSQLSDWRSRAA